MTPINTSNNRPLAAPRQRSISLSSEDSYHSTQSRQEDTGEPAGPLNAARERLERHTAENMGPSITPHPESGIYLEPAPEGPNDGAEVGPIMTKNSPVALDITAIKAPLRQDTAPEIRISGENTLESEQRPTSSLIQSLEGRFKETYEKIQLINTLRENIPASERHMWRSQPSQVRDTHDTPNNLYSNYYSELSALMSDLKSYLGHGDTGHAQLPASERAEVKELLKKVKRELIAIKNQEIQDVANNKAYQAKQKEIKDAYYKPFLSGFVWAAPALILCAIAPPVGIVFWLGFGLTGGVALGMRAQTKVRKEDACGEDILGKTAKSIERLKMEVQALEENKAIGHPYRVRENDDDLSISQRSLRSSFRQSFLN